MIDVFWGCTDLRISLSRAKLDEEADFEVCLAVPLQKARQNNEKQNIWAQIFVEKNFGVETRNVENRPKRILKSFVPTGAMFKT